MISVHAHNAGRILATISMGFDPDDEDAGPFLDPLNIQSKYSKELMKLFLHLINSDPHYLARLQRHYVMFKEKVDRKPYRGKPFESPGKTKRVVNETALLGRDQKPAVREQPKVGRNRPCPCGSGKKYKKCCMLKPQGGTTRKGVPQTMDQEKPSGKADDRRNISGSSFTSGEINEAKAMVKRVAGRLQRDPQVDVIDHDMKEKLEEDPRIVFALLHLLLKDHAPKGRRREMSTGYEAYLILIEEALTQIRYSVERKRQWAVDAAERIQKEIAAKAFELTVDTRVQADLVQALYNARLELHPDIKAKTEELSQYYGRFTTRTGPPDMDRLFDALVADGPDNPFELHEQVMAELNLLAVEGQLAAIAGMATARNPLIRELAAFMLLHPNREVRTHVPTIFMQVANPDTVAPHTLRRMIVLRNWLPEAERPALDELTKNVRLARVQCAPMPRIQSVEAYASPFDGSGVQAVVVASREKQRYQVAGMLVRQGEGIRDAWGMSRMSKADVKSMLREMGQDGMADPVEPAYLERLVSHFIWQGQQHGNPPPPELLQVAEAMGSVDWHPRPVVFEKELVALEKAGNIRSFTPNDIVSILDESGDWPEKMQVASSWFEDDARVDDLLKKKTDLPSRSPEILAQASTLILDEILVQKRNVWSERLLWMALWAKSRKGRAKLPWQSFFIVARELHRGVPLNKIPMMTAVAERSVYSAIRRMEEMPG